MATKTDHIEQFRAFIKRLCDTDVPKIVADGKWHRFRIDDTRSKASKPGAYLLHVENGRPNGIFIDWRDEQNRHKWFADGPVEHVDRAEIDRKRKERQAAIYQGFLDASANALSFWKVCNHKPGGSHPYLDSKGLSGRFSGARVGNHPAFGLGSDPLLIIPIRNIDTKLTTLQGIRADGQRRFFKDTTHDGGYTIIGDAKQGVIALCEGFATGLTINQATGWAVIVCVTSGNMERIARWASHTYAGRDFVVCGDDDLHLEDKPSGNVGRKKATHAALILGAKLVFPALEGADGSDFNDQAGHYGIDDVTGTLCAALEDESAVPDPETVPDAPEPDYYEGEVPAAAPERKAGLRVISPADWDGQPVPERAWRLTNFIPDGQATLFTGAGAVGKSLANQQLSTCIAMGIPFLGVEVTVGPALYITCEDDDDELQRRQVSICAALKIPLSATRGRLHLSSLAGEIGNELARFDADGKMTPAERYADILATAKELGVRHVTLDNTAHFFSGNENDRHQVAGFVSLCNRLAREIGGSVIVVGHPNKAGSSFSGSTAWENQVRSRLFMETPTGEDGTAVDPDLRVLRNEKANYSQRNRELRFVWHAGAFVHEDAAIADRASANNETLQQGRDNELFLRLLDQLTREHRRTSPSPRSGSYAPRVMIGMTDGRKVTKERLHAAMERLLQREIIENDAVLWIGTDRHTVFGLARKQAEKSDAE